MATTGHVAGGGLSGAELRLCERIAARGSALLDDLRLFVGLPTGPGSTGLEETRQRLTARAAKLGASCELIPGVAAPAWLYSAAAGGEQRGASGAVSPPPTAVCRRLGATRGRGVLIAGHLDTVHDASSGFRELSVAPGGRTATGPGCVDMKGGLVIAIHALEALAEAGVEASWSLLLNSDEETGSYHSDAALRAEASRRGADGRPAYGFGLALEPAMAGGQLAVSRGGSGQFVLEATGASAHVGRDFAAGASAVERLARGIVAASALTDAGRGVVVNVGPLRCDTPANVVADSARAWGNVRFPLPAEGEALRARLAGLADAGVEAEPPRPPRKPAELSVRTSFARPAKPLTPEVEALAAAARGVAEALGQSLPFGTSAGVCDGNNLQAAGLPTIDTVGVRGGGLHTPQEWIELPSLVERCQLLAVLVSRLSAGPGAAA